jgi:hypothetical protein
VNRRERRRADKDVFPRWVHEWAARFGASITLVLEDEFPPEFVLGPFKLCCAETGRYIWGGGVAT